MSERYLDRSALKAGDRLVDENRLDKELTENILKKLHQLVDLAHEWGLTLTQLTLAYMLQLPGMGPIIAASSTTDQLEESGAIG